MASTSVPSRGTVGVPADVATTTPTDTAGSESTSATVGTAGVRGGLWGRRAAAVTVAAAVAAGGYGVYATTIGLSGQAGTDQAAGTTEALDTTISCQDTPISIAPVYREDFAGASGYSITLTGFRISGLTDGCLTSGTTAMLAYNTSGTWQELATPLALSDAADGTLIAPTPLSAPASMTITGYSLRLSGGQAPTAPAIVEATNGNTATTVTWTEPTNRGTTAITSYQYTLNGGSTWTPLPANTSPVTIAGLTNNTTYMLALRAINATGPGPASDGVEITPQAAPEDTPADIIISGENTGL